MQSRGGGERGYIVEEKEALAIRRKRRRDVQSGGRGGGGGGEREVHCRGEGGPRDLWQVHQAQPPPCSSLARSPT
eukprot:3280629-Rhodomonas_salina.1